MKRTKSTPEATPVPPQLAHAKIVVRTVHLSRLLPHPANPRTHPEPGSADWESLKASLADVYFDPLVANERAREGQPVGSLTLASGHLRARVLAEMGCTKADVVVVDIPDEQHRRIMLRANRQTGDWDTQALEMMLRDMTETERLLAGFSVSEMESMFPPPPEAPGEFPEAGDGIATEHECPKCHYRWSGKSGGQSKGDGE